MKSCEFCRLSDESLWADFLAEIVPIEEVYIPRYSYESRDTSEDEVEEEKCQTIGHRSYVKDMISIDWFLEMQDLRTYS